ncbi:MAG: M48 family metallopeptidase [Deltaproteobacteria bacterium]|nr:M48 family metallopeptidase [Deltaproteobacteria bacterium]
MTDIYSQQKRNKFVTILLMFSFFVFALIVGFAVDVYMNGGLRAISLPVFTAAAAVLAAVNGMVSYFYGAGIVLHSLGATALDFTNPKHKTLHNVVTEMCIASGMPMPKVYVIADPAPNAFAAGRNPQNASVGVTEGLLDIMSRDELQAVIAHELGHVKSRDILTMTFVTVLLGTVSLLSDWAIRAWRYGGVRTRRKSGIPALIMLFIGLFVLVSPIVSRIMAMAISRNREYQADVSSAEFTRNPGALASALSKISGVSSPLKGARRGTAHLFISDPLRRKIDDREGFVADILSTHPPIERRIERLQKMAYIYSRQVKK